MRFTKRLPGIGHLTYRERLSALNLESLEIRRLRLNLLLTYILFGMADIDSHKLFCLRANIKPTIEAMVLSYYMNNSKHSDVVHFLADRTNGRAIATLLRLSVVCRL